MYSISKMGYFFDGFDENGEVKKISIFQTRSPRKFSWEEIVNDIMPKLPDGWMVNITNIW